MKKKIRITLTAPIPMEPEVWNRLVRKVRESVNPIITVYSIDEDRDPKS